MSQIRGNKIQVPTNSDAWNPTGDMATMADTSNVIIPVSSQAERDALTKKAGLCVVRLDLPSLPVQRCDGTNWIGTQHAEFTSSNTAAPNTAWGMGTFTLDAATTTDNAFVTINATDKLQVTAAGIYAVTVLVGFTATISGVSWLSADGNYVTPMASGLQNFVSPLPSWNLGAGAIIKPLLAVGTSGNATFNSRVRVTKVG